MINVAVSLKRDPSGYFYHSIERSMKIQSALIKERFCPTEQIQSPVLEYQFSLPDCETFLCILVQRI